MQATLKKIFGTDQLRNIPADKLKELSEQYPYFAPLQYLGLMRSKLADGDELSSRESRVALYFSDPLWFRESLKGWRSETTGVLEDVQVEEEDPEELEITENTPALNISYSGDTGIKPPSFPKTPEATQEELPIFQAFHTVDYFASQGIKISADMLQTDKFGRQLRSFTEWLRTMKRIPGAAVDVKKDDIAADPRVVRYAETSLREDEVLTEAMAEVLLKQGKSQGAIEIYNKLSLLNPHKSAYFASLIEKIKAV